MSISYVEFSLKKYKNHCKLYNELLQIIVIELSLQIIVESESRTQYTDFFY